MNDTDKFCYNCEKELGDFDCEQIETNTPYGLKNKWICSDCLQNEYDGKVWRVREIDFDEIADLTKSELQEYIGIHGYNTFEAFMKSKISACINEHGKLTLTFKESAQILFSVYFQLSLDLC